MIAGGKTHGLARDTPDDVAAYAALTDQEERLAVWGDDAPRSSRLFANDSDGCTRQSLTSSCECGGPSRPRAVVHTRSSAAALGVPLDDVKMVFILGRPGRVPCCSSLGDAYQPNSWRAHVTKISALFRAIARSRWARY